MTKTAMSNFIEKEKIDGFLTDKEGCCLYDLAKTQPKNSVIVEIGSWLGKSTLWLLAGSSVGNKIKVYAIDPHVGNEEHYQMYKAKEKDLVFFKNDKIWTYDLFEKNIRKAGLWNLTIPLVMKSEKASKFVIEPVSLIFIDGAHDYESVQKDYNSWAQKIVIGGIIAFHDARPNFKGVWKVINENIENNENWMIIEKVDSLLYARKLEN